MIHGKMVDSRMKVQRLVYVGQVIAAATVVLVVMVVEGAVTNATTSIS